ncbi:MAG TPA: ankyrin repeat domain-containing protein [Chthoniobacteraceae bacterium]|jgi:ankyrin repeat protein|nr:ankyrin repeat domain-containing protein [Chthoniobacteraceae bacterium]
MPYGEDTPFHQLLATKYTGEREDEAIEILEKHPEIAQLEWPGPDSDGQPFVKGSTALHYAANDGKLRLARRLIECGADVNASNACWFRSVLSWAANNARIETIKFLLERGTRPDSLDALHAAAWGGSACGKGREREYADSLKLLIEAGADMNDRRHCLNRTPLGIALESGNAAAIEFLRSLGAAER